MVVSSDGIGSGNDILIVELAKDRCAAAIQCNFPEARAVAQGINPGALYGDDREDPSAAVVWANGIEGFYLVGDSDSRLFRNRLDGFTDSVLVPRLRALSIDEVEISGDEGWNSTIEATYCHRSFEKGEQKVYTLTHAPIGSDPTRLRPSCSLIRADANTVANLSPAARTEFELRVAKSWGGTQRFLEFGIAYALLEGSDLASLCMSGFVADGVHVIDIETAEQYRGRGYAYAVGKTFLAECSQKGYRPHWDCMARNRASIGLAEKLGLTLTRSYTLYSFRIGNDPSE